MALAVDDAPHQGNVDDKSHEEHNSCRTRTITPVTHTSPPEAAMSKCSPSCAQRGSSTAFCVGARTAAFVCFQANNPRASDNTVVPSTQCTAPAMLTETYSRQQRVRLPEKIFSSKLGAPASHLAARNGTCPGLHCSTP